MKQQVSRKFFKKKTAPPSKKEEQKRKEEFPSNSRSIPERNSASSKVYIFLVCFLSGVLLMVLLLQENTIYKDVIFLRLLSSERTDIQKQILQWQHVMAIYPDYRDGYFRLATLEYQLGNISTARAYNNEALSLDPNFQSGKELAEKLK